MLWRKIIRRIAWRKIISKIKAGERNMEDP